MDLVKLERKIPIKAISEQELNTIIITQFSVWLANLLSLTDEVSAERLKTALPAVKEHCWSMGFDEIKRMFEMYADNKLNIEPIPNYFDRILFGKIVTAYKQQKPVIKKTIQMPEPTQEEKDLLIYEGLVFCYDNWVQTKEIIEGHVWIHDHLMELNLLEFTKDESKIMWNKAKNNVLLKSKDMDYETAKDVVRELEGKSLKRENEYKLLRLKKFFERIHAKGKHLKDFV